MSLETTDAVAPAFLNGGGEVGGGMGNQEM
jgi:hypothetical protein